MPAHDKSEKFKSIFRNNVFLQFGKIDIREKTIIVLASTDNKNTKKANGH